MSKVCALLFEEHDDGSVTILNIGTSYVEWYRRELLPGDAWHLTLTVPSDDFTKRINKKN